MNTKTQNPMQTMQAVVYHGPGGVEVMDIESVERPLMPKVGSGQVLIKVHAAGVNRPDVLQRMGLYHPPVDASPLLGLEVAGEVVGGDVDEYVAEGNQVCALTHGGGYAEYVVVERAQCLPVPMGWSMVEAASLPETFFTVWFNVFQRARLDWHVPETLLVHGGTSGIGVAAIQMAVAMGCPVWVSASSPEKREFCLSLGAQGVVDYNDPDWSEIIIAHTTQAGVDVVLDMVGRASLEQNIKAMRLNGRLAWIAFLSGNTVECKVSDIMAKQISLTGAFLRKQTTEVKALIAKDLCTHIWPKIELDLIKPVIDSVYPYKNVAQAHQKMESGAHMGKIVLQMVHEAQP